MSDEPQQPTPESPADSTISANQTLTMQSLRQGSAAWLLGWASARPLRDRTEAPRNADGTYNGRELVAWYSERMAKTPTLNAEDYEIATRMAESLNRVLDNGRDVHAILRFAEAIQHRHGHAGLAALFSAILDQCRVLAEIFGPLDAFEFKAPTILDLGCVCVKCGAVRRGREWVTAPAPAPAHSEGDTCPACLKGKK